MLVSIHTLLGALGLFLYGMKIVSEGLQRSAGDGLRKILGAMTRMERIGNHCLNTLQANSKPNY